MTDVQPSPPPDPTPEPPPAFPPPQIVVPKRPEVAAGVNSVVLLIGAVVTLIGYVQDWTSSTWPVAVAAVGGVFVLATALIRQKVTPVKTLEDLAEAIPQLSVVLGDIKKKR